MNCCPNCFSDNFLKNHIKAESHQGGNCSFCKSKKVSVLNPKLLFDRFTPLLELYEIDSSGTAIHQLLQNDWNVFTVKKNQQLRLLKAITSNDALGISKYKPIYKKEQKNLAQWEKFREELKHQNRFFPENGLKEEHLEPFGKHIGRYIEPNSQKLYRARINESETLTLNKMGKPPKKAVSNGRANPVGIPYLYLSSNIETAISEVRPHKGEKVTVAEFEIKKKLELADLRDPKRTISPFELNDDDELELIYKNMPFLSMLENELSKPIMPREARLEYLPTQYLCELFKKIGFHGIIFRSSIVEDGINYVIFKDRYLKASKLECFKISKTRIGYEKI